MLINIAGFQIAWFALVGGAARGEVWCGVGVLLGVVAVHLLTSRRHAADEFLLLAIVAWVGYVADSTLTLLGVLQFPPQAQIGWPAPIWMTALWVNFATTLNVSLQWASARPWLAAVLGGAGGAAAYFAGAGLGALSFGAPTAVALGVIAVQWALSTTALLALARWVRCHPTTANVATGVRS
jgi:hypothetical protein